MEHLIREYIVLTAAVFLCWVCASLADSCLDDPVVINEEFLACCKGRPLYSSENCIDAMLERSKFSPECLLECMYKEFLIYDGESIDLEAVKTFLDTKISNEDFKLVYMKAFERCNALEKSSMADIFPFLNTTNVHGCDEYPHYMDVCVWYYTLANCPQSYATEDDDACLAKNEWVQECLLLEA